MRRSIEEMLPWVHYFEVASSNHQHSLFHQFGRGEDMVVPYYLPEVDGIIDPLSNLNQERWLLQMDSVGLVVDSLPYASRYHYADEYLADGSQ
tara:strand:+ start:684 stop:962 length:279 start_codon:yes stop_codon:yes gene_type:complete